MFFKRQITAIKDIQHVFYDTIIIDGNSGVLKMGFFF